MSNTELLMEKIEALPDSYMTQIFDFIDQLKHKVPLQNTAEEKLSERFAGALRLSDNEYAAFQNSLHEGRNEWKKDTF
jgi:hypothetical protein